VRLLGAIELTVMERLAVVLPMALDAVTTYVVAGEVAVGVPVRTPVVGLSLNWAGSAGDTE